MGFVIGTDGGYSTWASLRGCLWNPGINDVVGWPPDDPLIYLAHNKYYPVGSFDIYPPCFFISESGTMLRKIHLYGGWYIQYPQFIDPSNPSYWEGNMYWLGMDTKDFDEMVGSIMVAPPGSAALEESAYDTSGPGQYVAQYNWGFGIQTIQKLKVLT
jgi:hypothetical protein